MDAVIKVVVRRGALSAWVSANPVLKYGEFGLVTANGAGAVPILIMGNGADDFNTLWAADIQKFVTLGSIIQNQLNPLNSALTNAINTEATNRQNADTLLQNQITYISNTQITAIITDLDAVSDGLTQELIDRAAADADLQAQFDEAFEEFKNNQGNLHSHWFTGEAINEGAPVVLLEDLLIYNYDPTDTDHAGKIIGLAAIQADSAGIEIKVFKAGLAVFENNVFGSGGVMYIDPTDGSLTNTEPTTAPKIRLGFSPFGNIIILKIEEAPGWDYITGKPTEFTPEAHVHTASEIVGGVLDAALLGSGTADETKILYGDGEWDTPKAGKISLFEHFNHFVTAGQIAAIEAVLNSGAGAGVTSVQSITPMGLLQQSTGTTATGVQLLRFVNNNAFMNSAGTKILKWRERIVTLSDGTNTFIWRGGFSNTIAAADGSQSVGFRYTHSENGGRFVCVSRQNNTETKADSGITVVANQFYTFEVRLNTTNATYYIDGVLVATITTNLPTNGGSQYFGYCFQLIKSVGTTARTVQYDYYHVKIPTY